MKLGTSVAAVKLGKKGAREGLPSPSELNYRLQALRDNYYQNSTL
jgi:sugar/nucleoside kinase (ribokinase family)